MFTDFLKRLPTDTKRELKLHDKETLLVTRWDWDYSEAHSFQKLCLNFVRENRNARILIFCNHPHVYTLGRGLQKSKGKILDGLVDFKEADAEKLSFPIHKIHRGGGLTFHYPGQWIFYPIINLNRPNWGLSKHFNWILESAASCLRDSYNLKDVHADVGHAGVWNLGKKIASIGVGIEHFTTYHGLALNLNHDDIMMRDISRINPCGLGPSTYTSVSELLEKVIPMQEFHQAMLDQSQLLASF